MSRNPSASKNAGRSTDGRPKVPYYPGSAATEAARHLRLTASRFLSDRALRSEVDEAIRIWQGTADDADAAHAPVEKIFSADNITNEQIVALAEDPRSSLKTAAWCVAAMRLTRGSKKAEKAREKARARVAEILNEAYAAVVDDRDPLIDDEDHT